MQGESRIKNWNGPVDWKKNEGRRDDLDDVKKRMAKLFDANSIEYKIDSQSGVRLTISSSTREYRLHTELGNGEYSDDVTVVPGPLPNGVWVDVQLRKKQPPTMPYRWQGPYWRISGHNYVLADENGFLVAEVRYGDNFPSKIVDQIEQIFGERIK